MVSAPASSGSGSGEQGWTHLAKVIVVGEAAVGKTSLLIRYIKGIFNPSYILTIGVQFFVHSVVVGDNVLRLQIWDTGGQERFGHVRHLYYQGARGGLIVYDKSDLKSFERLEYWLGEVENVCGGIPLVLVGNKADLPEAVTYEQGRRFAEEHAMGFVETSAKTNLNTEKAFTMLAQLILEYLTHKREPRPLTSIRFKGREDCKTGKGQ